MAIASVLLCTEESCAFGQNHPQQECLCHAGVRRAARSYAFSRDEESNRKYRAIFRRNRPIPSTRIRTIATVMHAGTGKTSGNEGKGRLGLKNRHLYITPETAWRRVDSLADMAGNRIYIGNIHRRHLGTHVENAFWRHRAPVRPVDA